MIEPGNAEPQLGCIEGNAELGLGVPGLLSKFMINAASHCFATVLPFSGRYALTLRWENLLDRSGQIPELF